MGCVRSLASLNLTPLFICANEKVVNYHPQRNSHATAISNFLAFRVFCSRRRCRRSGLDCWQRPRPSMRGDSSDDNCGVSEPRVGPSFQAEVPAFDGIRGTLGRRDDALLWHPDAAAPEVVEGFLRQAEQAIDDPRLVGSCDELALEALYQAAGDLSRASDALAYSVSQRVPTLWSEEETAELQDSVDAHGTNLRRVHASIANLSTRSFPECVSQHARSVEMWPLSG